MGLAAAQMRADGQSGQAKENAKGRERLEKGDPHEKGSDYTAADSYEKANCEETGSYEKLSFGKLLAARMFELAEESGNSRQSYSLSVVSRVSFQSLRSYFKSSAALSQMPLSLNSSNT